MDTHFARRRGGRGFAASSANRLPLPLDREAGQSVVGDGLEVDRVERLVELPVDERIAETDARRSQIIERVGRPDW